MKGGHNTTEAYTPVLYFLPVYLSGFPLLMPVLYRVQVRTHTGRVRDINEDTVSTVLDWRAALDLDDDILRSRGHLFAVADGMGGHAAGEIASQLAIATLFRSFYEAQEGPAPEALAAAIAAANDALCRQAETHPEHAGLGTTLVAALLQGSDLIVANVGDSRAYLFRNGQLSQITRDHSWVAEQTSAGVLTSEEAARHPYRNVITHSLGPDRDSKPDFFVQAVEPADKLLLCSDGLSNLVTAGEMASILAAYPADEAADLLLERSLERGAPDNVTLALVEFVGDAVPERRPRWVWVVTAVIAVAIAAYALRQPLRSLVSLPPTATAVLALSPLPSPTPSPSPRPPVVADSLRVADIELPLPGPGTPAPDPVERFGRTSTNGDARLGRPLPERYVYYLEGQVEASTGEGSEWVLIIPHRSRDAAIHRYVLKAPGAWMASPPRPGDTVAVIGRPVNEANLEGDIALEPLAVLAPGDTPGSGTPLWLKDNNASTWLSANTDLWVFTAYGQGGGKGLGVETPTSILTGAPIALWGGWALAPQQPGSLIFQALDRIPYELQDGVYRQPDN